MTEIDHKRILLIPVTDKKQGVIMLDIYVDGAWIGSRRTYMQCMKFLGGR